MAKTSSNTDKFEQLQTLLAKELLTFKGQHDAAEESKFHIARGNTLNRISKLVRQVHALHDPVLILDMERHCEQFDLEYFASTPARKKSSIQTLQAIQGVKNALAAPSNPEQYRADLLYNIGAQNMDKVTQAPPDGVHIFVKSQTQKLQKAPGRMAGPPEESYFRTRREALQTALKLHEENCEKALSTQR
jgi:hypothetical protein